MDKIKLNKIERDTLRIIYYANRELSTNQIAIRLNISPVTTKKILLRLKMGFIKSRDGKDRIINRNNKEFKSKSIILWRLNYI